MSLRFKITTIIFTLLLSVSVVSAVINYRIDVNNTQKQLKNISLPLSLDNIYTEIQQRMIEPLIVSSLMANDTFLNDWISEGEKDVSQIQKFLKNIQDKYGVFTSFLVSDKTKNYYHSRGLIDKVNKKNNADDWFFDFKKSEHLYEVNLDIDAKITNSLVMFINYKILNEKNDFIAATGIGIRLLNIEKMLYSFKNKYHYDVYFLDEAGDIILHTKELNKSGNIAYINGLKDIKSDIYTNKKHKFEYSYMGKEYLLSTKYIDQLKLYLLVEIDKDEYLTTLKKNFYINLFISLFVTLIITIIIIYTINIYQKKMEKLINEDALTKLANRRKFNDEFKNLYNLHTRNNIKNLRLALLDIDDFKKVNDVFGHLVGDKVLKRLADILRNNFRKTDIVARWGGEEFAIILIDTSEEESIKIINNLLTSIREDKILHDFLNKSMTVSIGFAYLETKDSLDGLILKADNALYEAKKTGKDKLVVAK